MGMGKSSPSQILPKAGPVLVMDWSCCGQDVLDGLDFPYSLCSRQAGSQAGCAVAWAAGRQA